MATVEVSHLKKAFGPTQAVADVSFAVEKGEIFGLLGPNGAGKTTSIRLMLDIFQPDAGTVSILDGPMTEAKKNRIGYMPEERGLYQEMPLEACLIYLATLKGLSKTDARRRLQPYLEHFDLAQHRAKKVKELSKGMQQKAQIISTVLHEPEILIMDEPFSGLDPVNTQLAKDLMLELHRRGVTIIMSTHIMHQVEELCNRIVLINQGRNVLYGDLAQIRREHSGHAVRVKVDGELPALAGVQAVTPHNDALQLTLDQQTSPQEILQQLVSQHCAIEQFEIALPSLDEIFIQVVSEQ
ncbi:MAG TPA: ATP-binding cassette domain-containing protein [Anaerolineae bacterium]|nr:ATP-binding cassette domain-containing protein [Anaerolineae bacterium]HNU03617.1 ATP-binding cassette domain-containing protein [Anaerolineae bacterium]